MNFFKMVLLLLQSAFGCSLSVETLHEDLERVKKIFKHSIQKSRFGTADVVKYFSLTSDRDYRLLQWFVGPGMHTRLAGWHTSPAIHCASVGLPNKSARHQIPFVVTHQIQIIWDTMRAMDATSVLEVGCGRGYCSLLLAMMSPKVRFEGIDIVPRHIQVARNAALRLGLNNVTFRLANAYSYHGRQRWDLIFGCESLCYMDTPQHRRSFLQMSMNNLRPEGCIIIIDGFRSPTFQTCPREQRLAMMAAEAGFRINAMPSKAQWMQAGRQVGFSIVGNRDLTAEALPFWSLGWRIARTTLRLPRDVLEWFAAKFPESAANWVAVCMLAHAMQSWCSFANGYFTNHAMLLQPGGG